MFNTHQKMKQLLSSIIFVLNVLFIQAQTPKDNLLGKWETFTLQQTNVIDGEKDFSEYSFEGERIYHFTSDNKCTITTSYTDIAHPHTYRIEGNKIYFTIDPIHKKALMDSNDEEYGIELEETDFEFLVEETKKELHFISNDEEDDKNSYQTIIILKKI